jgi:CheY-like chemotaxis protein
VRINAHDAIRLAAVSGVLRSVVTRRPLLFSYRNMLFPEPLPADRPGDEARHQTTDGASSRDQIATWHIGLHNGCACRRVACAMTHIPVIDDTAETLWLVGSIAERIGHQVTALNNALRSMMAFVRFKPDIVALDLVMPGTDGIEIIRWLADVDYPGRLIIVSGYADFDRMAREPADAYGPMKVTSLAKPFWIAQLEAALGPIT